jgi:hypothetical protein
MQGSPKTQRHAIARIGLPLGSAGGLDVLVLACCHNTAEAIASVAGITLLGMVTVVFTTLPDILRAVPAILKELPNVSKARTDGYLKRAPTRLRVALVEKALEQNPDPREFARNLLLDGGSITERQRDDALLSFPVPEQRPPGESGSGAALVTGGQEASAGEGTNSPEG